VVERIRHIEIATAVHRHPKGRVKLPVATPRKTTTNLAEGVAVTVKFQNAMVVGIRHIESPAGIHGSAKGGVHL
jgi:hypothetical protein